MKNIKLYENAYPNNEFYYSKRKKSVFIYFEWEIIGFDEIYDFLCKLMAAERKKSVEAIYIDIKSKWFANSSVIVILEYILANFLKNRRNIYFRFELDLINKKKIIYKFYEMSILKKLVSQEIDNEEFIKKVFSRRNDFFMNKSFRWYIKSKDANNNVISLLGTELEFFLKNNYIDDELIDNIIEIVTELSSNSLEHAKADVIIQCFIYQNAYNNNRGDKCDLIDITIVDFSKNKLYTNLKERFYKNQSLIPEKVIKAYDFHKNFFSNHYDEDSFFTLSTFQNKVTTRDDELSKTGGTGLTKFIESIAPLVTEDFCFAISGNCLLRFNRKYLGINGDEVGFNKSRSYKYDVPAKNVFYKLQNDFNGTLYSILLDISRGEENERN